MGRLFFVAIEDSADVADEPVEVVVKALARELMETLPTLTALITWSMPASIVLLVIPESGKAAVKVPVTAELKAVPTEGGKLKVLFKAALTVALELEIALLVRFDATLEVAAVVLEVGVIPVAFATTKVVTGVMFDVVELLPGERGVAAE